MILQFFLYINIFVLGVIVTYAIQHALAHYRPKKSEPKPDLSVVSANVRKQLSLKAEENFQGIVNQSALRLQKDLSSTSAELEKLLDQFGQKILDDEMKLFKKNVEDIRSKTEQLLGESQHDVASKHAEIMDTLSKRQADFDAAFSKKQTQLEAQLQENIRQRETLLMKELDDKLQDAVMSFLIETLGHEVDLGAQSDYLLKELDAHKSELLKKVLTMAANKLTLPPSIASSQDMASLVLELEAYSKWLSHEMIKQRVSGKTPSLSNTPQLSSGANQLLQTIGGTKGLTGERMALLLKELADYEKSAETITITLAALPSGEVKEKLVNWCRTEIAPNVLITFKAKRTIFGGLVLQRGSRIFDWSFRRKLLSSSVNFREVLERV